MLQTPYNGIVAISQNGAIGYNNQLPWKIKEDLRHFRALTMHHIVVMGKRTFDSLDKPDGLPGRINIVLTRDETKHGENESRALIFTNADKLAGVLLSLDTVDKKVFMIGGVSVFQIFMKDIQTFYVTKIHKDVVGDTFLDIPYNEYTEKHDSKVSFYCPVENCDVDFIMLDRK